MARAFAPLTTRALAAVLAGCAGTAPTAAPAATMSAIRGYR